MRPARRLGLVLSAVAGAAPVLSAPTPAAAGAAPARLLVYAQEWSMYGSRASLPAGRVIVQLWNRGQDPHDLRIRRLRGGLMQGPVIAGIATTQPGEIGQSTWRLARGRYELYCSLPGHLVNGMHFDLTVR